jgi:hypothetical protein
VRHRGDSGARERGDTQKQRVTPLLTGNHGSRNQFRESPTRRAQILGRLKNLQVSQPACLVVSQKFTRGPQRPSEVNRSAARSRLPTAWPKEAAERRRQLPLGLLRGLLRGLLLRGLLSGLLSCHCGWLLRVRCPLNVRPLPAPGHRCGAGGKIENVSRGDAAKSKIVLLDSANCLDFVNSTKLGNDSSRLIGELETNLSVTPKERKNFNSAPRERASAHQAQ